MITTRICCQCLKHVGEHQRFNFLAPKEVKMLEVRYFSCNRMSRKLLEHHFDIDKAVTSSIYQDNGRFDVSGWEFRDFVIPVARTQTQWCLYIIIVHLEALVANDLEPVHYALCAGKRV